MKLNNQVLSLFIALVISFVFVAKSSAQEGTKRENLLTKALNSIDLEGRPSEKSWRGNRQDFSISKEELSFNTSKTSGKSRLFTDILLENETTWSGRVRFDKLPTKRNYAYILLADIPQHQKESKNMLSYEYLALSIGGQGRRNVALVVVELQVYFKLINNGKKIRITKIELGRDDNLINAPTFYTLEESLQFDFKVHYDYQKAKLSLNFRYPNQPPSLSHIGTINWQGLVPQKQAHSFGLLVSHTKSFRKAMHFDKLCITRGEQEDNEQIPEDKPDKPEDKEEEAVDKPIIITEVMPNPKAGSEEYIELYNPNNKAIDLTPYQIGIGSNDYHIKKVGLRSLDFIPAKSYLVLSRNPEAVIEIYPSCPKDLAMELKLPYMNNKGCYICLYQNNELVDGLYYEPKQLPRGLQSKRGLAWEREGLEHYDDLGKILWHIGAKASDYASPGLPNSKGEKGGTAPKDKKTKKDNKKKNAKGEEISLENAQARLEQEKELLVEVKLYDLTGALLYKSKGDEARTFLAKPFTRASITNASAIPSKQILISVITLSSPKKKNEILTLKGFIP